jgi:hypothetical protein
MNAAFFRDFAQRCRTMMRASRIKATRSQLKMWADELDQQAQGSERDDNARAGEPDASTDRAD